MATAAERHAKSAKAKSELDGIRGRIEAMEAEQYAELNASIKDTLAELYRLQGVAEVLDDLRQFRTRGK